MMPMYGKTPARLSLPQAITRTSKIDVCNYKLYSRNTDRAITNTEGGVTQDSESKWFPKLSTKCSEEATIRNVVPEKLTK